LFARRKMSHRWGARHSFGSNSTSRTPPSDPYCFVYINLIFPASRPTIVNPRFAAGKKQSVSAAAAGALTCTISLPGWDTVSVGLVVEPDLVERHRWRWYRSRRELGSSEPDPSRARAAGGSGEGEIRARRTPKPTAYSKRPIFCRRPGYGLHRRQLMRRENVAPRLPSRTRAWCSWCIGA